MADKISIKSYEHIAQYYETDQMKIIHHSNYVRWMESARIDYLEQIGCPYDEMERLGILSPVLSVSCEYKSPVRFGETVIIEAHITKYDGLRFNVAYEIRDKESGTLRVKGTSTHCFVTENMRPVSLKRKHPDMHEKLLRAFESETEEN